MTTSSTWNSPFAFSIKGAPAFRYGGNAGATKDGFVRFSILKWGIALSAIHDSVNTPWTVESLAEAADMSRSAFAARFKELLGQTPLEYVTEWRMQKAMQLLQQRDKKLIDVARSVGYESDAAFRKAFSELSGPTLVNTLNVVLKTRVMPEWRKYLKRRILTLARGWRDGLDRSGLTMDRKVDEPNCDAGVCAIFRGRPSAT